MNQLSKKILNSIFLFPLLFLIPNKAYAFWDTTMDMSTGMPTCLFCDFVGKFIQIFDHFAKNTFSLLSGPILEASLYCMAIWYLIQVAYLSLGIGPGKDPSTVFWNIIKKSALFFLLTFMLNAGNANWYWENFYETPISETMMIAQGVGSKVQGTTSGSCGAYSGVNGSGNIGSVSPISPATISSAVCLVQQVEQINGIGLKISLKTIAGIKNMPAWKIGEALLQIFTGTVLLFIYGIAILYFAFFIMDIFLRITILTALAPFWIIFYLFSATRQFSTRAIMGVVQSLFTIIAASAIYGAAANLMSYLPQIVNDSPSAQKILNGQKISTLQHVDLLMEFGMSFSPLDQYFWYFAICGILVTALTKKIQGIMQAIFSFNDGGFGMADTATNMATQATKIAISAAGGVAGTAGGAVAPVIGRAMGNAKVATGLGAMAGMAVGGAPAMALGMLGGTLYGNREAIGEGIGSAVDGLRKINPFAGR